MVVLVWDVWPRWHFQPLWHRLRVHCLSRTPSWWTVPVQITVLFRTIWALVICLWPPPGRSPSQTTVLGPSWGTCQSSVSGITNELISSAGFRFGSLLLTQWWLAFALPIASCGLRLDDEAVPVAVGIGLGRPICVPRQCQCGELVDAHGIHSFVCKRASARTARHKHDSLIRGILRDKRTSTLCAIN